MKNIVNLTIGGTIIIAGVIGVMVLKNKTPESPAGLIQQEKSRQEVTGSTESVVNSVTETPSGGVPLPTEEDIVRTFFALIDEGRAVDAVGMMGKAVTENDNYKQQWAQQFSAFESAKLTAIEPGDKKFWTNTNHIYMVTLKAQMKPESVNQPIPYYGWGNGENTRWVELVKEEGRWRIQGIATGP